MNEKLVPAVGYIRMSTDRQENSPERQRAEINKLAERQGYRIVKWYEDHGLTGTESANPALDSRAQARGTGRNGVLSCTSAGPIVARIAAKRATSSGDM